MNRWTVSNGPNPDIGEPFIVFETHAAGMVSIALTKPGPALVTAEVAEAARIRLGAAINAARVQRPRP